MNIFLLLRTAAGGLELVTPPLDSGTVLPGVTRQSVLDLAHNMSGIEVVTLSIINITQNQNTAVASFSLLKGSFKGFLGHLFTSQSCRH